MGDELDHHLSTPLVALPPDVGSGQLREDESGVESSAGENRPGTSVARSLVSGAGWNTAAEAAPVLVNIALTPFLIHGLGIEQYGIYALAATITIFLSSLDGGVAGVAQRYFSVNAGRGDDSANTRLVCSLVVVVIIGGGILSGADWALAPWLARAFSLPVRYRADAVFLLRTFGVLVTVGLLLAMLVSLIEAHQRFGLTSKVRIASYLAWAVGLYLTVVEHAGLRGVAWSLMAEQAIVLCGILPVALRYLKREALGLMPRKELWAILRFGGNVQIRSLANLINMQFDAIVIGAALPVRFVGLYNAGSNPATQIYMVSFAALAPLTTYLARVYGESGERAARAEMARAQRLWVAATAGLGMIEVGAGWFAVRAWLGSRYETSAWVTLLLLAAYGFTLLTGVLSTFTIAVGRPRIQMRAGVTGMLINVVLTVPMAFWGVLPVVAATLLGQVATGLYLVRLARREFGHDLPSLVGDIPVARCLCAGALTVGLEFAVMPVLPTGPLGLLAAGVPAAIALVVYGVSLVGLRRAKKMVGDVARSRSLQPVLGPLSFG